MNKKKEPDQDRINEFNDPRSKLRKGFDKDIRRTNRKAKYKLGKSILRMRDRLIH